MSMRGFSVLLLIAAVVGAQEVDYCDPELCPSNNHIACGHSGEFDSTCPADAELVDFTTEIKQLVVDDHNEKRDYIAGGNDPNHDPACRMSTMQWDPELAELAALNVKQCAMRHDECRNTHTFKYSGQNLAWIAYYPPLNETSMVLNAINMWFSEVKDSKQEYIDAYPYPYDGPVIGHFTAMMNQRNQRVGCAASTYTEHGQAYKVFLFACNYAATNVMTLPIYEKCDEPALDCSSGYNPDYPSLCSACEEVDSNNLYA